jgi:two-component system response regulator YesN
MYNILIVDDEPLICKGLANLLSTSGLHIQNVFTAHSGYEAMDYIRMEEIHLLVTDIQMGKMSGIELMQQAKLVKPWVETIIISAHETFQYAQMAIRLGAKNYLIKPLNSDQFLDSVRDVLLKQVKPVQAEDDFMSQLRDNFQMNDPIPQRMDTLNQLITNPSQLANCVSILQNQFNTHLKGPYFSLIKIKLTLSERIKDKKLSDQDWSLLQYGALNIVSELLDEQWDHVAFYSPDQEISIIIQWDRKKMEENELNKIHQLDMIGRGLHFNICKFLGIQCVVGISQILLGVEFMNILNDQARKAISWNREHKDHYVLYYGDFNWHSYAQEPTKDEVNAQNNLIVQNAKAYIDSYYAQNGLTLHEVAQKNHVSPNYLSYLFKKYTGLNLWEYVIKLRMEESKRLLLHTDLRRYEIAEQVGYESPEHFSKIFKKYFGISPSECKK